ncbi:uncharacterized protein LOC144115290 isoform X1 [Amblyomma americanum]
MDVANLERFADIVEASQSIRRLNMMMVPRQKSIIFLRRFSAGITANYTLTRVVLLTRIEPSDDWFCVMDTARRNSDLVNRAIVFVTASRFDKYCATALKPVAEHRAILQEFAEIATVSEAEAAGMIRSALYSLQDMHNFMRAVGVVKKRVVCYPREDVAMQLDELHFDCWLHVRQHLQLEDVKYPGPSS